MDLLTWIIVGAIAGWLAGFLTKTSTGLLENIILGIVGGLVGGFVLDLVDVNAGMSGFSFESIFTATLGAILLIVLRRALTGRR